MNEKVKASNDEEESVEVCGFSSFSKVECAASAVNTAGSGPPATISQFIELAGISAGYELASFNNSS